MLKIAYYGNGKDVNEAKKLTKIAGLEEMHEGKARLAIQELIDKHDIKATIMINSNSVWSKKKILKNLKRIMKYGRLYDTRRPRFYPIGDVIHIPGGGDVILSKYFYDFLHGCCGSIAHYSIQGWVATYPTLDDLKKFFEKNEYGKRVIDDIPEWKTDAKEIVEAIERKLFPIDSYIKSKQKK